MIRFLKVIAVGFFSLLILLLVAVRLFSGYLETKINPARYSEFVLSWNQLFPREIDKRAEKVAFLHQPAFLQGGQTTCLRMTLPKEAIEEKFIELRNSGRTAVYADALPSNRGYPPYGYRRMATEEFHYLTRELPAHFRVFLYETDLKSIQEHYNHNQLSFTAISETDREIVYYTSSW